MRPTKIIAILLKIIVITLLIRAGLSYFECGEQYIKQPLWFWILIYFPLMAGYESLLSVVLEAIKNLLKNNKNGRNIIKR